MRLTLFISDVRSAWRRVRQAPVFTLLAVVTFGTGLGTTAAAYSVVRSLMRPPPGVDSPSELVHVHNVAGGSLGQIRFSVPDFEDLSAKQDVFERVAAWTFFRHATVANQYSFSGYGEVVTAGYFDLLGVRPQAGRLLHKSDDRLGAWPVAVISDAVWQQAFHRDPYAPGRLIKINGEAYEVVGVAPKAFRGLYNKGLVPTSVWVSVASASHTVSLGRQALDQQAERNRRWLFAIGRLKDGASLEAAQARVTLIASQLDSAFGFPDGDELVPGPRRWAVRRGDDVIINENADRIMRPIVGVLMSAVVAVFLIVCSNFANFMLVALHRRGPEAAVRMALGASRWSVIRASLIDTLLFVVMGAILGLSSVHILLVMMGGESPAPSLHLAPAIDHNVVLAVGVVSAIAVLIAGVWPAWRLSCVGLRALLDSGASATLLPQWRGLQLPIAIQVCVSFVLFATAMTCAELITKQTSAAATDQGGELALVMVDLRLQGFDAFKAQQFVSNVLKNVRETSGISAAASTGVRYVVPASAGSMRAVDGSGSSIELFAVTPGALPTLGVRIIRGRGIDARDTEGQRAVLVVSESAARAAFGTIEAVGYGVLLRPAWSPESEVPPEYEPATIVGVIADEVEPAHVRRRHGVGYTPMRESDARQSIVFVARAQSDADNLVRVLRRSVAETDADVAVVQAGTATDFVRSSGWWVRSTGKFAGFLGGFALSLVLAGLYGLVLHWASYRRREMALRQALGATPAQVQRQLVLEGVRPVVLGLAVGLFAALVARYLILIGGSARMQVFEPTVFLVLPMSILAGTVVVSLMAAWRSGGLQPGVVLRDL